MQPAKNKLWIYWKSKQIFDYYGDWISNLTKENSETDDIKKK